jgi:hypothetical protein
VAGWLGAAFVLAWVLVLVLVLVLVQCWLLGLTTPC